MEIDKNIYVVDDVLSSDECDLIIENFNNIVHYEIYCNNELCTLYYHNRIDFPNSFFENVVKKIFLPLNSQFNIGWAQIVKWPKNSSQDFHVDTDTICTSITYLNDNYNQGETQFQNGIKIKPKKGRTVYFSGVNFLHGVNKVLDNERYTLPIWYI